MILYSEEAEKARQQERKIQHEETNKKYWRKKEDTETGPNNTDKTGLSKSTKENSTK